MVSIAKAHSAFTSQSIAAWEHVVSDVSHSSLILYCTTGIPANHVITWHAVWHTIY